jgi:TetR/AcrR family transcriptional regulator, copper-responsive repressor
MGRPKNFSREEVLQKAIPLFWKQGFADTSLQDLEKATGVNKSGLYSEFKSKEELFLESLRYYLANRDGSALTALPLGWDNIENFLKQTCPAGQKGCLAINSMRELAIVPPEARAILATNLSGLKRLIAKNVTAKHTRLDAESIADIVLTYFVGLSLEQNLGTRKSITMRKIEDFMQVVQAL